MATNEAMPSESVVDLMANPTNWELTIGREANCDVVLNFPEVSRRHAKVIQADGQAIIEDLQSTNGTFVNGQRVNRSTISPKDLIQIGRETLVFDGAGLRQHPQELSRPMRVDAVGIAQTAGKDEKVILHGISFSILPGELVAIVGPSGAGKTTLLKALTGAAPGVRGAVFLNGVSFYEHPSMFRTALGYVPQDDIVHKELTIEQALRYAIRLRFADDVTEGEIEAQVQTVLAELDLEAHRKKQVKHLSGGQRKRVNVAIELVARPTLVILDEPTTGLDPHLERDLIKLCQRMSRKGRTVVLTTHSTQALALCDLVLFVAPGGHLAFYGPPREALRFFEVSDFPDIYAKLQQNGISSDQWAARYITSKFSQRYVQERIATAPSFSSSIIVDERGPSFDLYRFTVLVRRYLAILLADRLNTGVLLLQAPVISLILALIFPPDSFTGKLESSHLNFGGRMVFLLVISAIWFGTMNAAREIVKELPIYQRERMTALPISSYLASKVAVLGSLCVLQVFVLLLILGGRMDWFDLRLGGIMQMHLALTMAAFGGMGMGLAVSAVVSSSDQAISLTPVALIVQVALSGMFINPDELNIIMRAVSKMTASHWGFASVGHIADLNGRMAILASTTPFVRQRIFDQSLPMTLSALAVLTVCFLLLAGVMLRSRDRM